MSTVDQTRDVILRYWKSWQTQDWDTMRNSLADEVIFGGQTVSAEQIVAMSKQGNPWRNVTMVSSLFTEDEGAIIYDGVDITNEQKHRFAEFIKVEDGKVKSTVACFGSDEPPQ